MSNTNFSDAYKELNSVQLINSPKTVLQAYLGAFEAKDALAIQQLIGDRALIEMPLLKPNRLFGISEIFTGHQNVFRSIEDANLMNLPDNGTSNQIVSVIPITFSRY